MIQKRTVFVLGAGASKPYGFPTGPELRHDLVMRILAQSGRADVAHASHKAKRRFYEYRDILGEYVKDTGLVDECQEALGKSWATSVDMFMATQPAEIRRVCKAGIVLAIAEAESQQDNLFFSEPQTDWFRYLWRFLHRGCTRASEVRDLNNVSFITFNYDRTLEWSLANGIAYGFRVSLPEAIKALPRVVHFYGDLGDLTDRAYGTKPGIDYLDASVARIQVVGENDKPTGNMEAAEYLLKDAEQVIFLGFGYDETNMRLLGVTSQRCVLQGATPCYGTLYGLQPAEAQAARGLFAQGQMGMSAVDRWRGATNMEWDSLLYLRQYHHLLS